MKNGCFYGSFRKVYNIFFRKVSGINKRKKIICLLFISQKKNQENQQAIESNSSEIEKLKEILNALKNRLDGLAAMRPSGDGSGATNGKIFFINKYKNYLYFPLELMIKVRNLEDLLKKLRK
jgi:hypothetical protein